MNSVNWFTKILRPFLGWIDSLIYGLISWILEGIFNLADLTVSVSFVQIIYKRIYLILAIFMVFKLTFSFIKYLISPDMMTDKEKGVGKIVSRSVVMLAILVFLPIVFFEPVITANGENKTILTAVQEGVLNTLPKIILGINNEEQQSNIKSSAKKSGENMAVSMLSSLYYDEDGDGIGSIKDFYDYGGNEGANTLMDEGENDQYKYTYMWPLTTIAGVLLVVILLGIAIDVAIRTFKLMILQVIAPIPVMSYIDPKSSKDGAFNSWIKAFTSTYLDLFVKLGTVYLLLLLIGALFPANGDGIFGNQITQIKNGSFMAGCFVKVFLIIGLFKFAKDAPKFIKEAMGIKDNGGGGGFMGKALAGMAGAAAGFAGGLAAGGGLSGGLSGAMSGYSAGAQNAGSGKPLNAFSKIRDEQAKALGKTPGGMQGKIQQRGLQRTVAKQTGLNAQTLAAAKSNMYAAAGEEAIAQDAYQRFIDDQMSDDEKNTLGIDSMNYDEARQRLYDDLSSKQTAASKAKSNYEKANKVADSIGLTDGFMDENRKRNGVYRAAKKTIGESNYDTSKGTGLRGKLDQLKDSSRVGNSVKQRSDKDVAKGGFDPNKRG